MNSPSVELPLESLAILDGPRDSNDAVAPRAYYRPPWTQTYMIGVAGPSGSGKTSLALAILQKLQVPFVVLLSQDSFYRSLSPEQSAAAFRNEYDFDSPDAIDFDLLVEVLRDVKAGRKADVPVYSFAKHAREEGRTTTIYSAHVVIVEGIFCLHDKRVLDLLDLKLFADAEFDLCLSRRLVRDVRERGRDIEGCVKQWFSFVRPNALKFVMPQREVADVIIPRGIENLVAISMVTDRIRDVLAEKSKQHTRELQRLGQSSQDVALSGVLELRQTNQVRGISSILMDKGTSREDFIFYFDRLVVMLIEEAINSGLCYKPCTVETPVPGETYNGLRLDGEVSAVVILRGGSALETGLMRVIPDCRIGRMLIQTNYRTGEPQLHYLKLAPDQSKHRMVLLLDSQLSSGGAALMAVRVLIDHGIDEERIVFLTYSAGKSGLHRLKAVFPQVTVIVARVVDDLGLGREQRWIDTRYLGC